MKSSGRNEPLGDNNILPGSPWLKEIYEYFEPVRREADYVPIVL
jgi:hypothetical protein